MQEQIKKIETEIINNDKTQKAVIDFMEQRWKIPITEQQSNRNRNIKMIRSTNQIHLKIQRRKQIKCDIVALIDSNGKYLKKNSFLMKMFI